MNSSGRSTVPVPHANRTLVIMAKAPRPGKVKTRLMENLPTPAVTALYCCLLKDTLTLAKSLTGVEVAVMCPEADQDELERLLGKSAQVVAQQGSGLVAGLTSVFQRFTADGQRHVVAFNSDSPHLPPTVLDQAFEILAIQDVVVGPTNDGGYYLVGAKSPHPSLFEADGMGTMCALDRLLARTKELNLSTAFTESFYDIDVASDLVSLAKELQLAPEKAPCTAAWSCEWRKWVERLDQDLKES